MLNRIGYVVNAFPKLSETFIAEEVSELLRRGVNVKIYSLTQTNEAIQHELIQRCGLLDHVVYTERDFRRWIVDEQPQRLHAHFATQPTKVARELAVEFDLPFTFTAHGYDVYRKAPSDLRDRARDADAVITVSRANSDHLVRTSGIDGNKVHVVPCGVDTDRFVPAKNPPGVQKILCVARLVPVKNLSMLINACGILRIRGVPFRCSIVGDGRCRDELQQQIDDSHLTTSVQLLGALSQQQVIQQWQQADIGVLSSTSEGMPVSLMEAASSGVPVVATDVGGVRELVQHEKTGLVVSSDDPEAFANALQRLIERSECRMRMSRVARQHALERFSVRRQVDRLLSIWQSTCVVSEAL